MKRTREIERLRGEIDRIFPASKLCENFYTSGNRVSIFPKGVREEKIFYLVGRTESCTGLQRRNAAIFFAPTTPLPERKSERDEIRKIRNKRRRRRYLGDEAILKIVIYL